MNFGHYIADGIFVVIAALLMITYAKRGFIKSFIRSARLILSIVAAYLWGSALGSVLCERWFARSVRSFVFDKVNGIYCGAADTFRVENVKEALPSFFLNDSTSAKLDALEGTGSDLVEQITDTVATPVASLFSNILGCILVFVLSVVVLSVGAWLLEKVISHITLLDTANTLLGLAWGSLVAVFVLFSLASLLRIFLADSAIYTESVIVKFFGESKALGAACFPDFGKALTSDIFH